MREIHLYSQLANSSVRVSLQPIIQEGLILQEKAARWKKRFTPPRSDFNDLTYEKQTLCEIDLFLAGLVSLIRRSLSILERVSGRLSPTAAYRVRHLIYNSEIIVFECLPPVQQKAWRTPLRTLLLHPTLWTSRLLVSVSVLPLVLFFDTYLQQDSQEDLPSVRPSRSVWSKWKLSFSLFLSYFI